MANSTIASSVYLKSNNIDINKLKVAYTQGIAKNLKIRSSDISQQTLSDMVGTLNVDWSSYTLQEYSDSTAIIEFAMPDDTLLYALGNVIVGDTVTWKNKTEAVFLLKNDTLQMSFFMKVIEDQTIPDSLSAIDSLHYLQTPSTFNGQVLYFTLDRQLINGYGWQNGAIVNSISPGATSSNSGQNSINKHKVNEVDPVTSCYFENVTYVTYFPSLYDWDYVGAVYTPGTVLTCSTTYIGDNGTGSVSSGSPGSSGGVSGGGGSATGSGSGSAPVVKCPQTTVSSFHGKVIASVAGCAVTPVKPPSIPFYITLNTDALGKDFPCAVKLVINNLLANPTYSSWVTPFLTPKKPDLIWTDGTLPWDQPVKNSDGTTSYSYELGDTQPENVNLQQGATITLNTQMLQNSSQLFIAAAAIHETLHAYINYGLATAEDDAKGKYVDFSNDNWLLSIDQWCIIDGLPSNFSNHFIMMSSYFDQAVSILKTWDKGAHTTAQYAMAMLYGMNTADLGNTPSSTATPAEVKDLQTEYNNIKTEYNLTDSQIDAFDKSQLNASKTYKLPGNCN